MKKEDKAEVQVVKFETHGGHDNPPKKKKKDEDSVIPINESDVQGLEYLAE